MNRSRYSCPQCGRKFRWIERVRSWRRFGLLPKLICCPACEAKVTWAKQPAFLMMIGSLCTITMAAAWIALAATVDKNRFDPIFGPAFLIVCVFTFVAAQRLRFELIESANNTLAGDCQHADSPPKSPA